MKESQGKFYYGNILASQNITAQTKAVWVADITHLELIGGVKAYVFLCIDAHTNYVVASAFSKSTFNSSKIVRALESAILKEFKKPPEQRLIIHTDRGTQFSSKTYKNFTNKYDEYFIPSMSRFNTPTDNAVAERFMRTFKQHQINNITIEQRICREILLSRNEFKSYRACLNDYVNSLNQTPNAKARRSPERDQKGLSAAVLLMRDPIHPKARSEHIEDDLRLPLVQKYKDESETVFGILEEIAARKAELVDNTPFDFENDLAFKIIDKRLGEIYAMIEKNSHITREYVCQAVEPIEDSLESLHKKVDILLPKNKRNKEVKPLRDPLDINLFPIFFNNAGSTSKRQSDLRQAQLRVAYTLLYHTGLRLNELRTITQEQINNAIKSSQLSIIQHKTKQAHIHIISENGVSQLKNLNLEYEIIFNKYQSKYLFGKRKPMHKKSLIRIINEDLAVTCHINAIPYNIKSHSFRINVVSNLLRQTSVQNAAQIVGHKDIKSTMSYQRYSLSKQEIQKLLKGMDE